MVKVLSIVLLILLLFEGAIPADSTPLKSKRDFKYFRNYTPKDYDHHPQNWTVIQDRRGVIYIGNQAGLLQYDGVSWRLIDIPNWSVRSLAIDDKGTIFIGGKDEIGFLAVKELATIHYVSLLDRLKEGQRNFSNVKGTHVTAEGIYFRAANFLFRWNAARGEMKVWESRRPFKASSCWQGQLLVQQEGAGLMIMVDGMLQLIPGGETFAEKEIFTLCPFGGRKMLIGTRQSGFYIYDGRKVQPFPTGVDDYIKEKKIYHGIRLSDGHFALATLLGGVVIMDAGGVGKQVIDKGWGLQDEDVKYVFEDLQGNLWLALNKGVAKIEYASPFSIFDDRSHLTGMVLSVARHPDGLYVGTTNGLFCLKSPGETRFQPVPGITSMCWSLLSAGSSILAATTDGLFEIENGFRRRLMDIPSFVLHRSRSEPKRVWVGTNQGLVSLFLNSGTPSWRVEDKLRISMPSVRTIVEDAKGDLWLGTLTRGVIKISFTGGILTPVSSQYDTEDGLPPKEINVFWAAGHVMYASGEGIYRFVEERQTFVPDLTLGKEFADGSRNVFRIAEAPDQKIWFHSKSRNYLAIPAADGSFTCHAESFRRIPITQVNAILPDDAIVWFGTTNGLIRYDTTIRKRCDHDFSTLIRRVQLIKNRLPIFNGAPGDPETDQGDRLPVIEYMDRNLRFQFAAPFFEDEPSTNYQVFLEGYDEGWSDWSPETQKDYTNLHAGTYTFQVRGENIYEKVGREATFGFRVLPPWYQTWWAILLYSLVAFGMVFLIVRWRSGKLKREKRRLEQIVKDRTGEIDQKNRQLEAQSKKLKEMDQLKSRFFANISHEFRTPLTLIMGPLEQMIADCTEEEPKRKFRLMQRNSQRLLNLINQLLELSKFDSGKAKLQVGYQNMVSFLKGIAASFDFVARQHDLDLSFHHQEEDIGLYFDAEKIEAVIGNLLINAVKFTPPGGKITVGLARNTEKESEFPTGSVDISVSDTGPGIPPEQLSHVFDRFFRLETPREHRYEGSGIGLAIAREVVELHQGQINVRSEETKGTTFTVRLPLGDAHLNPEEIIDTPPPATAPTFFEETPPDLVTEEKERVEGSEMEAEALEKNIILVVEDNADVREYIRDNLHPLYTVAEAADGDEGISRAREIVPDLIISDIMMPGIDGYELCRVLKSDINTSHIPIIMLTARAAEEDIIEGLKIRADDYITKPFSTKILLARIQNLIDLRNQSQQKVQREMKLEPVEIPVSSMDQNFMQELSQAIEKNLSDFDFNVDQLSGKLYMSRTSLYRKILALTGESPVQFIRTYRLKRAMQLLKANFGNVTEVAFAVGFSSTAYFTKCFKEKFHQIPSDFQTSEA